MEWIFLALTVHLLFGLSFSYLACREEKKKFCWFIAGTLLGGMAFLGFLIFDSLKPFTPVDRNRE